MEACADGAVVREREKGLHWSSLWGMVVVVNAFHSNIEKIILFFSNSGFIFFIKNWIFLTVHGYLLLFFIPLSFIKMQAIKQTSPCLDYFLSHLIYFTDINFLVKDLHSRQSGGQTTYMYVYVYLATVNYCIITTVIQNGRLLK